MREIWHYSPEEAETIAESLGIHLDELGLEQFRLGLEIEREHGSSDPTTDVTHDDPLVAGRIVLAHLRKISNYYTQLEEMESQAEGYHLQTSNRGDYL